MGGDDAESRSCDGLGLGGERLAGMVWEITLEGRCTTVGEKISVGRPHPFAEQKDGPPNNRVSG